MCEYGSLDAAATVVMDGNQMSCAAVDMSFSKDAVVEGTSQCDDKREEFSDACCYTMPDNPCRVCSSGSDVRGDATVNFYGETMKSADIASRVSPESLGFLHRSLQLLCLNMSLLTTILSYIHLLFS